MTIIVHLITGLEVGGAEMALFRLLEGLPTSERQYHRVISMIEVGPVGPKIEALGVRVDSLHMSAGRFGPGAILRLINLLGESPDWRIQGWMYHANLLASAVCLLLCCPSRHLWCIRNSLGHMEGEKPLTGKIIRLSAWLSRLPRRILYVARRSAEQHEALGYCPARTRILPVGYDVASFAPDPQAQGRLRALIGEPTAPLIGHVGRWDWSKDHNNFFAALTAVPQAHGVLIGKEIDIGNTELMALIRQHGVENRVHLLGYRADVPALMAGLDLLCLSSVTEAQPNAVGEAMACAVPCVVTDVGDAATLVGDTGWVVPPQAPQALAAALQTGLASDLPMRGKLARERILTHYTRESMIAAYRTLYTQLGWT